MQDLIRKVNYYETDKMGITHHSNYIRWMEEARTAFLDRHGCGYSAFEAQGITSPVLGVECRYKQTTTFDDEIGIEVSVEKYTGVKVTFSYVISKTADGSVAAVGRTEHCFIDGKGFPIIVRDKYPALDSALKALASDGK